MHAESQPIHHDLHSCFFQRVSSTTPIVKSGYCELSFIAQWESIDCESNHVQTIRGRFLTTSQRENDWEKIVANDKIQTWLKNDEEHVLPIMIKDFRGLSLGPAKLIPTYETKEIPKALKSIDVELLRNQKGGCLLIKKKAVGSQTLFPNLSTPTDSYSGLPFQSIPELSVLRKPKSRLVNEETGIHLAWAMGILQSFLMEVFSPYEQFAFGGRLKTRVKGKFRILGQEYPVDALVEADGYFESRIE